MSTYEEEQAVIKEMLEIASEHSLDYEVMETYKSFRKSGDEPSKAAACALYEWDI